MPILDHAGGAVATTITGAITSSSTTITLADATGWPSGGANGEFYATINRGLSSEERILIQSRAGNTLTLASAAKRGVDGTAAASHDAGSSIDHGIAAAEVDEVNAHAFDTTRDDHTQYHTTARHAAVAHTQAMLQADSVGAAQIQANAVGSSELADNAVDTAAIANLAVTAGKIANDTITATQLAADSVGTSELGPLAVTAAEIAADAVTTVKILDDNVTAAKIADGAIDAAPKIVDAIVTLAKFASEAPTDYAAITFTNPTGNYVQGAGGSKTGMYYKLGRLVFLLGHFTLGTGGNITGADTPIEISLPFANNGTYRGFCAARARTGAGVVWSGTGVVAVGSSVAVNFATAGGAATWDGDQPFNWDAGDSLDVVIVYAAAA